MKRLASPLAFAAVSAALAQEPLVRLTLDQADLTRWRWKSNCTFAPAAGERGGAVAWQTRFGEFDFGWATRGLDPRIDFTRAGRVTYWVKGDGAGHRLQSQLVVVETGKASTYYVNTADAVTIDFSGWREVSARLSRFAPPAGRDVIQDMADRVTHLQFFLIRQGESGRADLMLDDVRVVPASGQEAEAQLALWKEYTSVASADVPKDGGNLLPNAASTVYARRGLPQTIARFFPGMPFDPPRAGISPSVFMPLRNCLSFAMVLQLDIRNTKGPGSTPHGSRPRRPLPGRR